MAGRRRRFRRLYLPATLLLAAHVLLVMFAPLLPDPALVWLLAWPGISWALALGGLIWLAVMVARWRVLRPADSRYEILAALAFSLAAALVLPVMSITVVIQRAVGNLFPPAP